MASRKNPVFLRVVIIVVALLLGLSLNMFQFRDPFRNIADETVPPGPPPSTAEPGHGGPKPNLPDSPDVNGQGDQSSQSMKLPEHAPIVIPKPGSGSSGSAPAGGEAEKSPAETKEPDGKAEPASASASGEKAAETGSDQASREKPADFGKTLESSELALPKVTSDAAVAKAAGVGRKVPAKGAPEPAQPDKKSGSEPGTAPSGPQTVDAAPERPAASSVVPAAPPA